MPYIVNAERVSEHGGQRSESFYNELHLNIGIEAVWYLQYDLRGTAVEEIIAAGVTAMHSELVAIRRLEYVEETSEGSWPDVC